MNYQDNVNFALLCLLIFTNHCLVLLSQIPTHEVGAFLQILKNSTKKLSPALLFSLTSTTKHFLSTFLSAPLPLHLQPQYRPSRHSDSQSAAGHHWEAEEEEEEEEEEEGERGRRR